MLKRALGILMILGMTTSLMIVACNPQGGGDAARTPVKPASMFFERAYNFCSDRIQDRFLIGYYGDALLESQVHFYVVCHRGDTIYHDKWAARDFFTSSGRDFASDSATVAFVKGEMQALIDGTSSADVAGIQDSVKQALGLGTAFAYTVAGQHPKTIVYSKKEKRVVVL